MSIFTHPRPRWSGCRIAGVAQYALDLLIAMPLFVVPIFLAPLLKPRDKIAYSRYRYVNGSWDKTFMPMA